MARGRYRVNRRGYAYVLNEAPDVRQVCELAGYRTMREAQAFGGPSSSYVTDTISGVTRFHTRVSTERTMAALMSERKNHALRNTIPRM